MCTGFGYEVKYKMTAQLGAGPRLVGTISASFTNDSIDGYEVNGWNCRSRQCGVISYPGVISLQSYHVYDTKVVSEPFRALILA